MYYQAAISYGAGAVSFSFRNAKLISLRYILTILIPYDILIRALHRHGVN